MNRHDTITARALRRSLTPGPGLEAVAAELAVMAGGRRDAIRQAILRIDRAQSERCSRVGERAVLALLAALELVDDRALPQAVAS